MAKVLNLYGYPISLVSKDGESCLIPVGESKVQDKFCANVPPKVKVLEIKKPAVVAKQKEEAKPAIVAKPQAQEQVSSSKVSSKQQAKKEED